MSASMRSVGCGGMRCSTSRCPQPAARRDEVALATTVIGSGQFLDVDIGKLNGVGVMLQGNGTGLGHTW